MGFLYKYDKTKVWMQNVIKELLLKTHEKFLLDSMYHQWQTETRNFASSIIAHLQLVWTV